MEQNDSPSPSIPATPLFSCRCESARAVYTLLSSLRHVSSTSDPSTRHNPSHAHALSLSILEPSTTTSRQSKKCQHATVYVSSSALTFHVHGMGKQSQASVDMHAGMFSSYFVAESTLPIPDTPTLLETVRGGEFTINLTSVLQCLHVLLGANKHSSSEDRTTGLSMSYDSSVAILKMELMSEDPGAVLSTCAIPGLMVAEEEGGNRTSLALAFRTAPVVCRAIFRSEYLRRAILELGDVSGANCCTIGMMNDRVELGVVGSVEECLVQLPRGDGYVSLECESDPCVRTYPLHLLLQGMRGLEIAKESCVTMNQKGMIAIQHQVVDDLVGDGQPNYVDFIMGAIVEEDEDETVSSSMREEGSVVREVVDDLPPSVAQLQRRVVELEDDTDSDDDDDDDHNPIATNHPRPLKEDSDSYFSQEKFDKSQIQPPSPLPPQDRTNTSTNRASRKRPTPPPRASRKRPTPPPHVPEDSETDSEDIGRKSHMKPVAQDDEDGSSSPELLFGDISLTVPGTKRKPMQVGLEYKKSVQYSDDDTEEEEF